MCVTVLQLVLAAVSGTARQLLQDCSQPVSHILAPDIHAVTMQRFVTLLFRGTLDTQVWFS